MYQLFVLIRFFLCQQLKLDHLRGNNCTDTVICIFKRLVVTKWLCANDKKVGRNMMGIRLVK